MTTVSIHEAKTHLSAIITEIEKKGAKYIICRHGCAVAELSPARRVSRTQVHPEIKTVKINGNILKSTEDEWNET